MPVSVATPDIVVRTIVVVMIVSNADCGLLLVTRKGQNDSPD